MENNAIRYWKSETDARNQIKEMVAEYYSEYIKPKENNECFKPGDRVSYASRVFDEKEMQSLTDAMLDFCLHPGTFLTSLKDNLQNG